MEDTNQPPAILGFTSEVFLKTNRPGALRGTVCPSLLCLLELRAVGSVYHLTLAEPESPDGVGRVPAPQESAPGCCCCPSAPGPASRELATLCCDRQLVTEAPAPGLSSASLLKDRV